MNVWCQDVGHDFMWLMWRRDWYSGANVVGPEYKSCSYWTDLRLIICMWTTWLKCALRGISIPSYAVSVVWERPEPLLLNKWFSCNPELFLTILLLDIRYNLVPVTRIEFGRIKGRGDGRRKVYDERGLGVFRKKFNNTTRIRSGQSVGYHIGWTRQHDVW